MIQAVFFDIDGTLLHHSETGSEFPESTRQSLYAMQKKGIKVFVATGRIHYALGQIEGIFPFDGYVALNGQIVMDADKHIVYRKHHHPEDIRALLPIVKKEGVSCLIIEEEESFPVEYSPEVDRHFHWMMLPVPPRYDPARLEEHPVLQFLLYMPFEEGKKLLSPLPHVEVTSAGGSILDCIPKDGGKEVGIAAAAERYRFARENIMVFGDGINDIRMIRWAGIGVAMGNAAPEVKAAADYVTTHVAEDGVKNALLHLGVLSPEDFPNT